MIIYKCIVSNDEMFSDIYKIKLSDDGMLYEVEGKMVTRTEGDIDDSLIGGNASAEEVLESSESSSVSGVDIVLNHKLQETSFDKKSYTAYIKTYMKMVKAKLEEAGSDRKDEFVDKAQLGVKKILGNFKNYQFFTGESMNTEGAVALLDFREDGITPYMLFFRDGLVEEKC